MRADRLIATVLLLQRRERVTARELADELEISVATARRDLEALSAAGVPVYPQPGRGGGWQLVGGARTDLSGLTADEAQALFLLAGPVAGASNEAKGALRKLVRALPAPFRDDAEAAAGATMVDPAGWGERGRTRPELVDRLQGAVVRRRRVRIGYSGRERVVDPWGLIDKDDVWYLLAGTPKGQRTFRVDRITSAQVLEETFERPDEFTLTEAWERVVEVVEERRAQTWATVSVPTRFLFVLHEHFGRHCLPEREEGDRTVVRVAAPTPLDLARTLAGWGSQLLVLDAPAVQAQLRRIGAELVAAYPAAAGSGR